MKALIACEFTGRVRDALTAAGWDAISCDFRETQSPGKHHKGDVLDFLKKDTWDLLVAFPPCTYLAGSGWHWNYSKVGRHASSLRAADFAEKLFFSKNAKRVCLENPVGKLSAFIGPPSQVIQPYHYGDDASKRTCLWLRGLPLLRPTGYAKPRQVSDEMDLLGDPIGVKRWSNQANDGQNKLGESKAREMIRSKTYLGISKAMGEQWTPKIIQAFPTWSASKKPR